MESVAFFRFEGELNDHLPPEWRDQPLEKRFHTPGTVKDAIESFGVPHTEVDSIVVNDNAVDFSYLVQGNDQVAVSPYAAVRAPALHFVLDVHLGRLAAYLRMLGFDTFYRSCASDTELARISARDNRILLTRDRGLLMRTIVEHGYWLRSTDSRVQLREVSQRYDLIRSMRPWTLCMACNGLLRPAAKAQVAHRVPPRTLELHEQFSECASCGRVYWKGSHYDRMQRWIGDLRSESKPIHE